MNKFQEYQDLSDSLVDCTRSILEVTNVPSGDDDKQKSKNNPREVRGGKTKVELKPQTNDRVEESVINEEISPEAHELVMFADNHAGLHKSSHEPIINNLKKKVKRGEYDSERAKDLWKYHADRAAQQYTKEHGSPGDKWHEIFSPEHRKEAAVHWEAMHRDDLNEDVISEKHEGFAKVEKSIEDKEGYGKKRASAIAAAIGRKKYGAKKFAAMAHHEEVISPEEQEKLDKILASFKEELGDAAKNPLQEDAASTLIGPTTSTTISGNRRNKTSSKLPDRPNPVSAPIRGATQDQGGDNPHNSTASYTISDEEDLEESELERAHKMACSLSNDTNQPHHVEKNGRGGFRVADKVSDGTVATYKKGKLVASLHNEEILPQKEPKTIKELRGGKPISHLSKEKTKVTPQIAQHLLNAYSARKEDQQKDFVKLLRSNRKSLCNFLGVGKGV